MVGAGTDFDREDRFFNSVKPRRSSQNQPKEIPVTLPLSNLERFLQAITPSVPAEYLSKTTMTDWRTCSVEYLPYFVLGDLWESFKEWSAYGAGVPLVLNGSDSVVQYYVPYLSAIQIYVDPSNLLVKSRRASEDTDGDSFSRDSCSDGSSDSEPDRFSSYSRGKQSHRQMTDVSSKMERLSFRDQQTAALQEGFSSDDSESGNSHGYLLFEYLEQDPPFTRGPLSDKISNLALGFPELKNLHSCDLMPSSWFSVAWLCYPDTQGGAVSRVRHARTRGHARTRSDTRVRGVSVVNVSYVNGHRVGHACPKGWTRVSIKSAPPIEQSQAATDHTLKKREQTEIKHLRKPWNRVKKRRCESNQNNPETEPPT